MWLFCLHSWRIFPLDIDFCGDLSFCMWKTFCAVFCPPVSDERSAVIQIIVPVPSSCFQDFVLSLVIMSLTGRHPVEFCVTLLLIHWASWIGKFVSPNFLKYFSAPYLFPRIPIAWKLNLEILSHKSLIPTPSRFRCFLFVLQIG